MKFRKNHVAMKKAMFVAFNRADEKGASLIEQLNLDVWQSPAIACSRMSTAGLLDVHSSTAYDEALQIITAFVGKEKTVDWIKANEGAVAVAHVGNLIQLEVKIKEGSKRQQMLVRFQPVKTNVLPDDLIIEKNKCVMRSSSKQLIINI